VYDSYSNMSYPRLDVNAAIGLAYTRSGSAFQGAPAPTPTPTPAPTPTATSTAFKGTPFAAGATIEAEWYDNGGEGVAFHDTTNFNESGLTYRGDGVDVGWTGAEGGANYVGWTHGGEWLKYSISTPTSGGYSIQARVSSSGNGGTFHVEIDGKDATGAIAVPNTGGWDSYVTVSKDNVWINAGQHTMRVVMDTNGGWGFTGNFNWFKVNPSSSTTGTTGGTTGGTTTGTAYKPNTWYIPNSPFAMTATAASSSSLKLNWYDNADNEAAFVIERANASGVWSVIATVNADQTSSLGKGLRAWTDTGLLSKGTYSYRVKAVNQIGSSNYTSANGTTW
jgi:hypothetical protein